MKQSSKMRKPILKQLQRTSLEGQLVPFQSIWVRVFHWGFAVSLTGILLTGLELHKPANFLLISYGRVVIVHIVSAWLAMGFFALRVADAFITRDTSLIPRLVDLKKFPELLAYYFFLRSSPPPVRKYNSGQLLIYPSWFLLFLVASFLGLASYWQGKHLLWVWHMVGGFQILRWIKFSITVYFFATIPLHIYLSVTENISRLQAMLTGYERKLPDKRQ